MKLKDKHINELKAKVINIVDEFNELKERLKWIAKNTYEKDLLLSERLQEIKRILENICKEKETNDGKID